MKDDNDRNIVNICDAGFRLVFDYTVHLNLQKVMALQKMIIINNPLFFL